MTSVFGNPFHRKSSSPASTNGNSKPPGGGNGTGTGNIGLPQTKSSPQQMATMTTGAGNWPVQHHSDVHQKPGHINPTASNTCQKSGSGSSIKASAHNNPGGRVTQLQNDMGYQQINQGSAAVPHPNQKQTLTSDHLQSKFTNPHPELEKLHNEAMQSVHAMYAYIHHSMLHQPKEPNNHDHEAMKLLQDKCLAKDREIDELKREVQKLKHELKKSLSGSKPDPDQVDLRFRGNVEHQTDSIEKEVKRFYDAGGMYSHLMNEVDDLGQAELGELMVFMSQMIFQIVKAESISKASESLGKLFTLQPSLEEDNTEKLEDIQHAYGLLCCQNSFQREEIWSKFVEVLAKEENKKLQIWASKIGNHHKEHKELLNEFASKLIDISIKMVSVSPPMILHTQDQFDKNMAQPVLASNRRGLQPEPPLQWTQPVLLRNMYGNVCVKGRADNKEELMKADGQ